MNIYESENGKVKLTVTRIKKLYHYEVILEWRDCDYAGYGSSNLEEEAIQNALDNLERRVRGVLKYNPDWKKDLEIIMEEVRKAAVLIEST